MYDLGCMNVFMDGFPINDIYNLSEQVNLLGFEQGPQFNLHSIIETTLSENLIDK